MGKTTFKSQASSARAISSTSAIFGGISSSSSLLSYVYEPPDLSAISDPKIVVALKNLQKRDSITKAKALEDLTIHLSDAETTSGLDTATIEAWISLYPRVSIDNARRVRQLAHALQGRISLAIGKEIAKHMPKVIGAWLSGQQDSDRLVARTAREALGELFSTEDKQIGVWKAYQRPILDFCIDAILKETPLTLSDERITRPDDAEAKYARVVGSAVSVMASALDNLSTAEVVPYLDRYRNLLLQERLWKFSTHLESFVRKSIYRLLISVLNAKQTDLLDLDVISMRVLQAGLHTEQAGSVDDFVKMLALLSTQVPDVWTSRYSGTGTKSASKRLAHFLRKGSHGGSENYWKHLLVWLKSVPRIVLLPDTAQKGSDSANSEASSLLEPFHQGLVKRNEHDSLLVPAVRAYLEFAEYLTSFCEEQHMAEELLRKSVIPLVRQYVKPNPEEAQWNLAKGEVSLCERASDLLLRVSPGLFSDVFAQLSNSIIEHLRTSLPEQSKDYEKSQNAIISEVVRWYELQATLLRIDSRQSAVLIFRTTTQREVQAAIEILKNRNGKPYSAAAMLLFVIKILPSSIGYDNSIMKQLLIPFAIEQAPRLLITPSATLILRFLDQFVVSEDVCKSLQLSTKAILEGTDSSEKTTALCALASSPWVSKPGISENLTTPIHDSLRRALNGEEASWLPVEGILSNSMAPAELTDDLLAALISELSMDHSSRTAQALNVLELSIRHNPEAYTRYLGSAGGADLLAKLFSLSDSGDETISSRVRKLKESTQESSTSGIARPDFERAVVDIVRRELVGADKASLSIPALLEQTSELLEAQGDHKVQVVEAILANHGDFFSTLEPFLAMMPAESLMITNPLGGALGLMDSGLEANEVPTCDGNGCSVALRIAWFIATMNQTFQVFNGLSSAVQGSLLRFMALFIELATDGISIPQENGLWKRIEDTHFDEEVGDILAIIQSQMASWILESSPERKILIEKTLAQLLAQSSRPDSASYYCARAYVSMANEYDEVHGPGHRESAVDLKTLRKSLDTFVGVAILASTPESDEIRRICNELVSALTSTKDVQNGETLRQLVLLNCLTKRNSNIISKIPKQRLVFCAKHVVPSLQSLSSSSSSMVAELMTLLIALFPAIGDVYDSFWESTIKVLSEAWNGGIAYPQEAIPFINASLRLYSILEALVTEEANEDLTECWQVKQSELVTGLLTLLQKLSTYSDVSDQPRRIVNEYLARLLGRLPPGHFYSQNSKQLYSVLASECGALQRAAYQILHVNIPKEQGNLSLEAALSKSQAVKLPEELLSLILTAPSFETFDLDHLSSARLTLRSYLFGWKLIFDHWQNASYQVQRIYVECIKEGTYLTNLMTLTFDYLIGSRKGPVSPALFDIPNYSPDSGESTETDTQWLLVNLFYLSLLHLPALSRTWWRDRCSRQLQAPVEAWTTKWISPLIIAAELTTVSDWLSTQPAPEDDAQTKVSHSSRAITASQPVDEQLMSIRIMLPPSYPLAPATVESINRVAVDEKKWRSWLISTQGIINFASTSGGCGAVIDGLVAWRKNVTGALKGQSECAICYSVVSLDGQLPTKRCMTCKNAFHGGCLFRWFKSSGSSSCPLCRNPFNSG